VLNDRLMVVENSSYENDSNCYLIQMNDLSQSMTRIHLKMCLLIVADADLAVDREEAILAPLLSLLVLVMMKKAVACYSKQPNEVFHCNQQAKPRISRRFQLTVLTTWYVVVIPSSDVNCSKTLSCSNRMMTLRSLVPQTCSPDNYLSRVWEFEGRRREC
jgi:hypothetical protein